ncbi:AraC family transcriptional regulator [Flavobacterium sp. GT3R68]|uniref:helix-turn-helix domain-containing protein n=1 Tax=Flavobacterium sp. GT3R68 TaxID=2594437 RepID=UPI000F88CA8C|nr:AraC family transcriptional regulator [Flavobacterium sp. GT3R68]RTY93966.1 helix-turn-helix domain-containing protein [Flavobacterium sp. GSN2]TRW93420.1 helix-turn-helix domain-containing protein [Flavobacterium sp. GT3R68]
MQRFKIISLCFGLFIFNISIAQDCNKIPDSLKKYSYLELDAKIYNSSVRLQKHNAIYSRTHVLKAKKENNIEELTIGYNVMAEVENHPKQGLKYSDSAIYLAKKKIPRLLSYLYHTRADLYYNEKKLKKSLDYYLLAYKDSIFLSKKFRNIVHYRIGVIKDIQGKQEEALTIYKKCEEYANKYKLNNVAYLYGLSELYNKIGRIKLSEQYTRKGIALSKNNIDNLYYYPYFISNRGKNYYKRKQYQKAIIDLSKPLKTIQNDYSNYAENCYYIGECYKKLHQEKKAVEYFKKVDSIFTVNNDVYPLIISAYQHLIDYYKKNQDFKQAIYYSDQFIKADCVIDDNYKYITSKIAKTYDIQKVVSSKQAVITSLKKEKRNFVTAILLLFLGLFLVSNLWYINNKKKQTELLKQRELFNIFKLEREQQSLNQKINFSDKKTSLSNIDESVIAQILSSLEHFEKEQCYLHKEYTVEILATEFKTNSNYLSRIINEIKGASFTTYINVLRIEYILEKLETDKKFLNYTIQGLSEFSGYNSVQTFTRAFTLYTKMKPSEFLKELRARNIQN